MQLDPAEGAAAATEKIEKMKIIKLILSLTIIAAMCAGVLASVNTVAKETIKGLRAQQTLDATITSRAVCGATNTVKTNWKDC